MTPTVAVIGSRTFNDYPFLAASLDRAREAWGDFTVVTGTFPRISERVREGVDYDMRYLQPDTGADQMGVYWAQERGLNYLVYPAFWSIHGKVAGFVRNKDIAESAMAGIAFWDGVSRGTLDTINKLNALNKRVYVRWPPCAR